MNHQILFEFTTPLIIKCPSSTEQFYTSISDREEEIHKMCEETNLALKHKEEVSTEPQNSLEFKRQEDEY